MRRRDSNKEEEEEVSLRDLLNTLISIFYLVWKYIIKVDLYQHLDTRAGL